MSAIAEYKQYKIDDYWGINCITWKDGSMSLEVFMLQVPWQEIVESTNKMYDKTEANNKFKELVSKYRSLKGGLIEE